MLTTKDGHPVLGENGPITFQKDIDDIQIENNGQIVITRGNQTEVAGTLDIVEALRPRLLEATGENEYRLPALEDLGYTANEMMEQNLVATNRLQSGALEASNVDVSKQMTDLIAAQRSYQFNARTISMGDQMQGLINQLR